jgi:transporter family protein
MSKWLLYSLICLILWGFWGVVLKLAEESLPSWKSVYVATNSAAVIIITIIALLERASMSFTLKGYLTGLLAGFLGTLGYIFLVLSLEAGGKASIVVALTGVYPALTAILSKYILGEELSLVQWIGVIFAVMAVVLLSMGSKPT